MKSVTLFYIFTSHFNVCLNGMQLHLISVPTFSLLQHVLIETYEENVASHRHIVEKQEYFNCAFRLDKWSSFPQGLQKEYFLLLLLLLILSAINLFNSSLCKLVILKYWKAYQMFSYLSLIINFQSHQFVPQHPPVISSEYILFISLLLSFLICHHVAMAFYIVSIF